MTKALSRAGLEPACSRCDAWSGFQPYWSWLLFTRFVFNKRWKSKTKQRLHPGPFAWNDSQPLVTSVSMIHSSFPLPPTSADIQRKGKYQKVRSNYSTSGKRRMGWTFPKWDFSLFYNNWRKSHPLVPTIPGPNSWSKMMSPLSPVWWFLYIKKMLSGTYRMI